MINKNCNANHNTHYPACFINICYSVSTSVVFAFWQNPATTQSTFAIWYYQCFLAFWSSDVDFFGPIWLKFNCVISATVLTNSVSFMTMVVTVFMKSRYVANQHVTNTMPHQTLPRQLTLR